MRDILSGSSAPCLSTKSGELQNHFYRQIVALPLRDPRGTLFRFRVNGHDAGKILWAPYELDLTPFLQPGTNRLEVTVVGSRQNTFGPLHDRESDGEGAVASPFHYESESSLREQWSLHDYGLMGGAELVCS